MEIVLPSKDTVYHEQMVQSILGPTLFHPKLEFFLILWGVLIQKSSRQIFLIARHIEPF